MPSLGPFCCFTFDNMGEAADVGAGTCNGVDPSRPHVSLTRGFPALYRMLERQRVRATFFIEGWNGAHHPHPVAEIVQRGHDLGMHGWTHEPWSTLDPARERELALRATEALTRAAGVPPTGFRAPGGKRTDATESILLELGYRYDASLSDSNRPGHLPGGLPQIPFVWPAVDGYYYLRPAPLDPELVRDRWLQALGDTIEGGGVFVLICHAFITGIDEARLAALEAVIAAATADARVRVGTMSELADRMRARTPSSPRRRGAIRET
jgi:peptidoglycan/xylan/chitin deacetylase (PgdA/CDA1 family)